MPPLSLNSYFSRVLTLSKTEEKVVVCSSLLVPCRYLSTYGGKWSSFPFLILPSPPSLVYHFLSISSQCNSPSLHPTALVFLFVVLLEGNGLPWMYAALCLHKNAGFVLCRNHLVL